MKEYLQQFEEIKDDRLADLHHESQRILSLLDSWKNRMTLKELLQKLCVNQDTCGHEFIERSLSDLQQKESELRKVDVLEEKINNELASLKGQMHSLSESLEKDRHHHERLVSEIQSLREEEDGAQKRKAEFRERLRAAEEEWKRHEQWEELLSLYENQQELHSRVVMLKEDRSWENVQMAKENAFALLTDLNSKLQSTVKLDG